MRLVLIAAVLLAVQSASAMERRLYVTDRTGISVYDIDRNHQFLPTNHPATAGLAARAFSISSVTILSSGLTLLL